MKDHKKQLQELIKKFRLIDDEFMSVCFNNNIECTELLLRIILNKPDIKVTRVKTQTSIKNLLGRDIRLDIDATDSENKKYNIEIQRSDKGADRKRARYHSSILDSKLLKPGDKFSDLPETYVIFITENDVIGRGKPLYRIERHIEDIDERFNDGEHIIYVNGSDRNSATELGRLMQDFFCENPNDMNFKPLADTAKRFMESQEGGNNVSKLVEDFAKEYAKEYAKEALEIRGLEIARALIKGGELSLKKIAAYLNLPLEQVKLLAAQQKNN